MNFRRLVFASVLPFLLSVLPSIAKVQIVSRDPYLGAIVLDAATGKSIYEVRADEKGYPASVLKLMDMLIIIEQINAGHVSLEDKITVKGDVANVGGTQVWLRENEVFTVEELLYALMIQSANDAAAALAIHVGGSKDGFVELMNAKAQELGMKSTVFHSVHGLPPASGGDPDVTTARDLSLLCLALLKHPEIFQYTSTKLRVFRPNDPEHRVDMRNHNHLLDSFEGCDGFKTGFFSAAGFSICATAERDGRRVIAVVLGSKERKVRDVKAAELLQKGFAALPAVPKTVAPAVVAASSVPAAAMTNAAAAVDDEDAPDAKDCPASTCPFSSVLLGIVIGLALAGVIALIARFKGGPKDDHLRVKRSR